MRFVKNHDCRFHLFKVLLFLRGVIGSVGEVDGVDGPLVAHALGEVANESEQKDQNHIHDRGRCTVCTCTLK